MPESPTQPQDQVADELAPVAGTVRLMTEDPVPEDEVSDGSGVWAAVCRVMAERPWVVPATLIGLTSVVLLVRRVRED